MAETNYHSSENAQQIFSLPRDIDLVAFFGPSDQVIRTIERGFPDIHIQVHDRQINIQGNRVSVDLVSQLVQELILVASEGVSLSSTVVEQAISLLQGQINNSVPAEVLSVKGKSIRAKTPGQQAYIDALEEYPIVFGVGPAGTGKTYLAMAEAVSSLLRGEVRRIVLTRPAVEAGENLGFLPGNASEKIDPYLRPLFDALNDLLDDDTLPKLLSVGAIEIAPLAYMRGRTLNDSYIILDEAQNTTPAQMKMFLTRLGFNSHMVITGDDSQVDLKGEATSGLVVVQNILENVDNVKFCYLTSADVVRNPLVAQIIDAYSRWESQASSSPVKFHGNRDKK